MSYRTITVALNDRNEYYYSASERLENLSRVRKRPFTYRWWMMRWLENLVRRRNALSSGRGAGKVGFVTGATGSKYRVELVILRV